MDQAALEQCQQLIAYRFRDPGLPGAADAFFNGATGLELEWPIVENAQRFCSSFEMIVRSLPSTVPMTISPNPDVK